MYNIERISMPLGAIEFASSNCNAHFSEDGRYCVFPSSEDLELYEKFLQGVSTERFRLDNLVYRMLKFLDLDHAWHFYCTFNPVCRQPIDPYHGVDLVKVLLSGLYEYSSTGNRINLRIAALAIIFQHFGHPLGRITGAPAISRVQRSLGEYLTYRPLESQNSTDHIRYVLHCLLEGEGEADRETRLLRDLNSSVLALSASNVRKDLYSRLYIERRTSDSSLSKELFLMEELRTLACAQSQTSWHRAIVAPIWENSVVNWAATFAADNNLDANESSLRSLYHRHRADLRLQH